jgi:hypothetical protein
LGPGLPDFLSGPQKYKIAVQCTKMAIKYTNFFHPNAFQNLQNWYFCFEKYHLATLIGSVNHLENDGVPRCPQSFSGVDFCESVSAVIYG